MEITRLRRWAHAATWLLLGASSVSAGCSKETSINSEEQLCDANTLRCSNDTLEKCDSHGETWAKVRECFPGSCREDQPSCPPAPFRCKGDDECESGKCLESGDCAPKAAIVSGIVQQFGPLTSVGVPSARVRATNIDPTRIVTSAITGQFTLDELPPQSALDIEVESAETRVDDTPIPSQLRRTRITADTNVDPETPVKELNPPSVPFSWLADAAVDCGLFEARADILTGAAVHPFFIQRSTLILEVRDERGQPDQEITRQDIEVALGGFPNTHLTAEDDAELKPFACALDRSEEGGAHLIGLADSDTSPTGRFVFFGLRNPGQTGVGRAVVSVAGYPERNVLFGASGNIGVAQIGAGADFSPLPDAPRDFERDVIPVLQASGCTACHAAGEPGADQAQTRGPDMLAADFDAAPDDVYAALMANDGDCTDDSTPARVCVEAPEKSLLLSMPLSDAPEPENHGNVADGGGGGVFVSPLDPGYQVLFQWIKQGALRKEP